MKKAVLFLLITACFCTIAQEQPAKSKRSLDLSYYSTHIGTNICGEYNFNLKRHSLFVGLKCHINRYIGTSSYSFFHKFYAQHPLEYIGASIGYKYFFKPVNPYVSMYFIYNFQYANMKTKLRHVRDDGMTFVFTEGPFHALENTAGFGLSVKLTEKFYLNQSAGVGLAIFHKVQSSYFGSLRAWEFMYQWRLGLSMKLD